MKYLVTIYMDNVGGMSYETTVTWSEKTKDKFMKYIRKTIRKGGAIIIKSNDPASDPEFIINSSHVLGITIQEVHEDD